ncbi:collagen triple helix repeat (20 copies) [Pedobacter glucosidilyticus]|nr:collagen triple helix repeat (20 copies) [Pedobacter glucosidilyticus]
MTGATGPQGPIGLTGATGAQGIAGVKGDKGDKGDQGDVGPQGPIGLTGATGAQGPIGLTGATGPQGPIGLTGATGPVGPIGLTGATGPAGATGPQGPAGTYTAGSLISISGSTLGVNLFGTIGAGGGDIEGSLNQMLLRSGAVEGFQIADGTIQAAKLANASVTGAKIQDGVITAAKLASASVTDAAIGFASINPNKLSASGATLNQVLSWNGGSWVPTSPSVAGDANATTRGIVQLAGDLSGTATAPIVAANAITSAKIADGTIATIDVADNAITSAKIADGTIVTTDIADNAITSAKILNGTILREDIADGAVTGLKIFDGSIISQDLADNAVTSAKITDGTIATADLADGSITGAKLNAMSATDGQVLKFNGTAWAPATEAAVNNWLIGGNNNATASSFLGTTNDIAMRIRSNNTAMLEFGRRETLGLTQPQIDYTDNNQPLVHVNGNGTTSALQFAASAAEFYKPMFFTTTEGNFRLKGSAAGTDFFELGSSGTGNNGRLDFIIGDDGDEPIVFSKFNYTTSASVEMMRMQGTGLDNTVRIGVNTNGNVANSTMQVNGSVSNSILRTNNNITLNDTHYTVIITGNGGLTITLPAANSCIGRIYVIKNTGTGGTKTVTPNYRNASNASASNVPSSNVIIIQSDGIDWQQIN